MPELPEAERARQALETALHRRIVDVDDSDTYVSRPHQPGAIAAALPRAAPVSPHRRGKFLWVETDDGPTLGLHLGMAGRILTGDDDHEPSRWDRFTLRFADGTWLALRDKRPLNRAAINPDFNQGRPDAARRDPPAFPPP